MYTYTFTTDKHPPPVQYVVPSLPPSANFVTKQTPTNATFSACFAAGATCMPSKIYHIGLWIAPISVSVAISLAFYAVVMFRIYRGARFDLVDNRSLGIRIAFFSLTCICWIPDVVVYSVDSITGCLVFGTVVLYNITRNLQVRHKALLSSLLRVFTHTHTQSPHTSLLQGCFDAIAFGSITYSELKKLYDLRYRNPWHKTAVILSFALASPFILGPLFIRNIIVQCKAAGNDNELFRDKSTKGSNTPTKTLNDKLVANQTSTYNSM